MVDSRIVPDLRWLAQHFPIYVTDGYSGPLPNGEHVGCNNCHVRGSDHYNGLAVDLVPLNGPAANATRPGRGSRDWRCGRSRSRENRSPLPLGGYDGDAGHGSGNRLTSPGTTPSRRGRACRMG